MKFLRLPVILCLLLIYASCKKDSSGISFTPSFYFLSGDTIASSFNNNLILFSSSDSITFNVILSSTYLLSKDADVTVGVDNDAIASYNSAHGTKYLAMPANAYKFTTTFTATTSSVFDTIPVTIYKNALNLNANYYLLPINIISAGGVDITLGSSVVYLHTITNKLSGIYTSTGIKTLYTGDAADSNVSEVDSFTITKSLVPIDTTYSQLDYADLGSNGWKYYLSFFSGILGAPPKFTVNINDVILNSVQSGSFKILSSSYDSTTSSIYIKSSYKNTSGNERIIEESLKLQ